MYSTAIVVLLAIALVSAFSVVSVGREISYVAAFLPADQQQLLLAKYPPIHKNVYANHMTMFYHPNASDLANTPFNEPTNLVIVGYQHDSKGQAVVVQPHPFVPSKNNVTHITISTIPGVGPVYRIECANSYLNSNEMLETEGWKKQSGDFFVFASVGASLTNVNGSGQDFRFARFTLCLAVGWLFCSSSYTQLITANSYVLIYF